MDASMQIKKLFVILIFMNPYYNSLQCFYTLLGSTFEGGEKGMSGLLVIPVRYFDSDNYFICNRVIANVSKFQRDFHVCGKNPSRTKQE